jgi:predicted RNA-binding Zn-ribbon protein involved in translation (DUF1610 family)
MMEPRKPKGGFSIGVTCPGCGGELTLQENYFSLTCVHCGSVLRIIMPDGPPVYMIKHRKQDHEVRFQIDRYLKENGLPLARSGYALYRLYAPYWKIDAIRLKVNRTVPFAHDDGLSAGDYEDSGLFSLGPASASGYPPAVDSSSARQVAVSPFMVTQSAAPEMDGIPFSIGLRTEYVTMTPLSSDDMDDQARFLPATISWSDVCAGLSRTAAKKALLETGGSGVEKWELFRPVGSLIYFPYLAAVAETGQDKRHFLLDGLTGRVIHSEEGPGIAERFAISETASPAGGCLQVVFHRCPNCGVDLPATRSVVYKCHNCGVVVSLETNHVFGGALQLVASTQHPSDRLFPFWVLQTTPETVRMLASLPAGISVGDRIIIPGFTIANFETMRRLCRRMTAVFPQLTVGPLDGDDRRPTPPVTTPLSEAVVMAEIALYSTLILSRPGMDRQSVNIRPEEAGLLYAPFHKENYFMIDSALGTVTFERGAVDEQTLTEIT